MYYLAHHLAELHREVGDQPFSVGISCQLDDLTITDSAILTGPHIW